MNIINTTVEFEERERVKDPNMLGYEWGNYEDYYWYGIMKMNGIPIFETRINYIYDDEQQMLEQVIEAYARYIKPYKETILA
jgi:hypothetical protein